MALRMRFPDDFLDRLRARVPIAAYAGRKITFDQRRSQPQRGDYWACCPFHGEDTPSFHVLDNKGIFKCFGCGAAGDVIGLCMRLEGLSFPEAVERLADEAGLQPPKADPGAAQAAAKRAGLYPILAAASAWFQAQLRGPAGRAARTYLEGRGLDAATLARFGVGFAPGSEARLLESLKAQGFAVDEARAAGLVKTGDDGRLREVFRNRVMFPIEDAQGRVIAFGGRILPDGRGPKYLNSPETPLFHKGSTLYRLKAAREALARGAGAGLVVAEGYLDVIALERAGVAAVAPLGTALTGEQLELIWRSAPEPVLCFDGDGAGRRAADRALDLALQKLSPLRSVRIALLPKGEDPDDVFRRAGPEAVRALLTKALPAAQALLARERDAKPLTTPEARAGLKSRLRNLAGRIEDPETRKQYLRTLMQAADDHLRSLEPPRGRRAWKTPALAPSESLKREAGRRASKTVDQLLRFAIASGALGAGLSAQAEDLAALQPTTEETRAIQAELLERAQQPEASAAPPAQAMAAFDAAVPLQSTPEDAAFALALMLRQARLEQAIEAVQAELAQIPIADEDTGAYTRKLALTAEKRRLQGELDRARAGLFDEPPLDEA